MNRAEKEATIRQLQPLFEGSHFYIITCDQLKSDQMHQFRHQLHQAATQCKLIPNALLRILFAKKPYESLTETLTQNSFLLFIKDNPSLPAKIIQQFQQKHKLTQLRLKGAWVFEELFIGDHHLTTLEHLKSREERIAEVVALLQAPAQRLVQALRSGQEKISRLLQGIGQ